MRFISSPSSSSSGSSLLMSVLSMVSSIGHHLIPFLIIIGFLSVDPLIPSLALRVMHRVVPSILNHSMNASDADRQYNDHHKVETVHFVILQMDKHHWTFNGRSSSSHFGWTRCLFLWRHRKWFNL